MTEVEGLKMLIDHQYGSMNTTLFEIKRQQNSFEVKIDKINEYVTSSKVEEAEHYYKCPLNKDVKELHDRVDQNKIDATLANQDLDFFIRHPWLIFIGVAVICVMTILYMSRGVNDLNVAIGKNKASIEQTEKAIAPIVEKERKSILKNTQ